MATNEPQSSAAEIPMPQSSRIEYVPLGLLDLHPLARKHSDTGLASLGQKMAKEGQLQNIVVCPLEGGRFQVICGVGRVTNARAKGWEKILASIREGLSEFQKLELMLSENEEREAENPIHKGIVYKGMMASEGLTQEEMAARIGISRQVIQQYLSLSDLPEAIRENANRFANLGLTHYMQILRLPRPEDQVKLAEEATQKEWTVRDLKAKIDKVLPKKNSDAVSQASLDRQSIRSTSSTSALVASVPKDFEPAWNGDCQFARESLKDVRIRVDSYIEPNDDLEYLFDKIRDEFHRWRGSRKASISDAFWLPETEKEMEEFEALAEVSPGPGPLYAKIYGPSHPEAKYIQGTRWEQFKDTTMYGGGNPKACARLLVQSVRQWHLPSWDRRTLPRKSGNPASSDVPVVSFAGLESGTNGGDNRN